MVECTDDRLLVILVLETVVAARIRQCRIPVATLSVGALGISRARDVQQFLSCCKPVAVQGQRVAVIERKYIGWIVSEYRLSAE